MRGRMLELLAKRSRSGRPLRVALIGAGTFGSMLLGQARHLAGLEIACVADLDVERAHSALRTAGYTSREVETTDDAASAIRCAGVEVVVEATGARLAGTEHALSAIDLGRHVVMVNVEADALAGPALAERARSAGVVYSLAYGDPPALICELVDWARCCGFEPVCAGKGTKYLPAYPGRRDTACRPRRSTAAGSAPGCSRRSSTGRSRRSRWRPSATQRASSRRPRACAFPRRPRTTSSASASPSPDGGALSRTGTVEVVSSLERDGTEIPDNLRWGVFVTFAAHGDTVAEWFRAYGLATDDSGRFAVLYRPYHLIGLEATVSVLSAGLLGEPTGSPAAFVADVVAVAKRNLSSGTTLDGEGGFTVHGALVPSTVTREHGLLPLGLADGLLVTREVRLGEPVRLDDVNPPAPGPALACRAEMTPSAQRAGSTSR